MEISATATTAAIASTVQPVTLAIPGRSAWGAGPPGCKPGEQAGRDQDGGRRPSMNGSLPRS